MKFIEFSAPAFRQLVLATLLVIFLFGLNSCDHSPGSDKPRSEVSILITNGGTPVIGAQVDLVNEQTGEGGGGRLDEQGKTSMAMVALGDYTLVVNPPPAEPVVPGVATKATQTPDLNIPQQVQKIATSPFKIEVGSGTNEFEFDLSQAKP